MSEILVNSAAMQPTGFMSFLFLLLNILVGCRTSIAGNSDTPDLCTVSSLVTPYFVPLLDTPRKTRGCSVPYNTVASQTQNSKSQSRQKQATSGNGKMEEVHVIMLQNAANSFPLSHQYSNPDSSSTPVRLNVNISQDGAGYESNADVLGRLILVLHSDHPVSWELMANYEEKEDNGDLYSSPQSLILISEGSTVEGNFNFTYSFEAWASKKALQRYVKKKYPLLASYTEVKGANHMELKVGSVWKPGPKSECNINSLSESHVLTASSTVQLKTEGCFHEDFIGDNQVDVYVVELDAGRKGNRPNRGPLPVLIQLEGEGIRPVPRNVTLVLKSHQPIRWQLGANRINGNIVVVSDHEDQVENSAVGGHQNLKVHSKPLPDNLPDLLLSVTTEFGPPILYAKTGRASTLRLLVGTTRNKSGLKNGPEGKLLHGTAEPKPDPVSESKKRGKWVDDGEEDFREGVAGSFEQMQQQPNFPAAPFVSSYAGQDPQQRALSTLRANMTVECGKTRVTASFSANLVRELGITRLTLNDPSCVSQSNETHVYISSPITSCGSTGEIDGKVVSSTNVIHVTVGHEEESDDEDFEESSGWYGDGSMALRKIPIVCKYHPRFPLSNIAEDPLFGSDDLMPEGPVAKMNLYHMELYRDKGYTEKVDFRKSDPSIPEAQFDETLYVKAWIDGGDRVQVVTENCWISNSSNPRERSRMILLRNTCPTDLSVKIEEQMPNGNNSRSSISPHGGFSFQVNKEYENLGQFYIHCRLGLCTSDPAYVKGNLILCVNTTVYCSRQSLRPYLDKAVSTAQQLVSKGPLRPVPRRRRVPGLQVASSSEAPAEGQPNIIYVGVSTEMTVGIALASFAIGVGLTGALWCIHMKTDPFRRQGDKQLPGARASVGTGVVTGCNLSPHSGCSSTNSQAAMTAT